MLTDLCIYTIKHSDDLRATVANGGSGSYTEGRRWARAKELLDAAKRTGKCLPIIFAPAEATRYLFGWALLDEIVPDEMSTYTFSGLRMFDSRPLKTTLLKASDGEPLEEAFIRPYAICQTPHYLALEDRGSRFWTCCWKFRYWRADSNSEYESVGRSAGNNFTKRGVSPGDVVYIVSLSEGQLFLGGKMTVDRIMGHHDAMDFFGDEYLYDANEHLIGVDRSGTPLNLHRRLSPALTKQLRFESKSGPKEAFFVSNTELDSQTTRGVRQLTGESASLLDRVIEVTDRLPRSDQLITVTEELLLNGVVPPGQDQIRLPEEISNGSTYNEGSVQRILINRYERDPRAREACIKHYGTICFLCGFNFVAVYGEVMAGFTHVHHLKPLSSVGAEYEVDPIRDLRPVCPNCHAVLHRNEPPYSLDEVREFLQKDYLCKV